MPHPLRNCLKPDLPFDVSSHPIFSLLLCPLVFGFVSTAIEIILSNTPKKKKVVINDLSFQNLAIAVENKKFELKYFIIFKPLHIYIASNS